MEKNKQWKRVPFTIELAKDIQSGKVEGRIVTSENLLVRIVDFNFKDKTDSIVYIGTYANGEQEFIQTCDNEGKSFGADVLFIELPEETPKHEFKPFDKVLVRDNNEDKWVPDIFRYYDAYAIQDYPYRCCANDYRQCILYAGNEHLVGTTDKPKEK